MEKAVCCTECQSVGLVRYIRRGTMRRGLALLCLFVVPGVLYLLWHLSTGHWGCSACGSRKVVPIQDPEVLRARGVSPEGRLA